MKLSIFAALAFFAVTSPSLAVEEPADPHATEVAAAESALATEVGRVYRDAANRYQQRDLPAAKNGFLDCYSLYQAAIPHLSKPESLKPIAEGCQRYLELIRLAETKSEKPGGLKWRLCHIGLPNGFRVREAEASAVIEQLRKMAEAGGGQPLGFTVRAPGELLARKITLDTGNVAVFDALAMVCGMAGLEMYFDDYSVTFTAAPVSRGLTADGR